MRQRTKISGQGERVVYGGLVASRQRKPKPAHTMNTYSIAYLNFNTGAREYIGSPMTSKQRAISTAKLHAKTAARGVCYEVHKETPGVVKHCVYQSGTGA